MDFWRYALLAVSTTIAVILVNHRMDVADRRIHQLEHVTYVCVVQPNGDRVCKPR